MGKDLKPKVKPDAPDVVPAVVTPPASHDPGKFVTPSEACGIPEIKP